jgi:hypothetical protein
MAIHPSKHKITSRDCFMFDTNVWILLFHPLGNQNQKDQTIYSDFFKSLLSAKSTIVINSLLLSEYVNACLKMDFKQWAKKQGRGVDYKRDYCKSEQYKITYQIVKANCFKIEKFVEKFPDDFHKFKLSDIEDKWGLADFNDCYFYWLSKSKNFFLVTNDSDFHNLEEIGLKIITAQNRK